MYKKRQYKMVPFLILLNRVVPIQSGSYLWKVTFWQHFFWCFSPFSKLFIRSSYFLKGQFSILASLPFHPQHSFLSYGKGGDCKHEVVETAWPARRFCSPFSMLLPAQQSQFDNCGFALNPHIELPFFLLSEIVMLQH